MSFFPVQKGFSRSPMSVLLSIPRAWKFSFTWAFLLSSLQTALATPGVWKSSRRDPLRTSPCQVYCCVLIILSAGKSRNSPGTSQPVICSTHNVKHIQTTCSSHPWPSFHQTPPSLFAPSVPGNSQLQELPKLPDLFWPLVAQCAQGKQCQQQLLIAGKASNHSEVVWVPQLYFCLLCSWLHTHKPQRWQFHVRRGGGKKKKKSVLLCYFK